MVIDSKLETIDGRLGVIKGIPKGLVLKTNFQTTPKNTKKNQQINVNYQNKTEFENNADLYNRGYMPFWELMEKYEKEVRKDEVPEDKSNHIVGLGKDIWKKTGVQSLIGYAIIAGVIVGSVLLAAPRIAAYARAKNALENQKQMFTMSPIPLHERSTNEIGSIFGMMDDCFTEREELGINRWNYERYVKALNPEIVNGIVPKNSYIYGPCTNKKHKAEWIERH